MSTVTISGLPASSGVSVETGGQVRSIGSIPAYSAAWQIEDAETRAYLLRYLPVSLGGTGERVPDLSTIAVRVSRGHGPVPFGVMFWLVSPDPNYPSLVNFGSYKWTFSQHSEENYTFTSLTGDLAGETAGIAFGPNAGHYYVKGPGTGVATPLEHQWSVTLSYPGLPDRIITHADGAIDDRTGATVNAILAHDPDYWFDGTGVASSARLTRYFSPDYTDDAAGIDAFYLDLAEAESQTPGSSGIYGWDLLTEAQRKSYLRTGRLGVATGSIDPPEATPAFEGKRRLCIRAGTTTVATDPDYHRADVRNIRLDRFGPGDNPIIDYTAVTSVNPASFRRFALEPRKGAEIHNITLRGPYNPVTPGKGIKPQYDIHGIYNGETLAESRDICLYRLDIKGFHFNIGKNNGVWDRFVFADCSITDWYNYGFWAQGMDRGALVGCRIAQNPNALMLQRRHRANNGGNFNFTHEDPALFTAAFNWSLQTVTPINREEIDPAFPTAIPAGYEIPASGAWGEHPWDVANPATPSPEDVDPNKVAPFAFSWWRRNYWRFNSSSSEGPAWNGTLNTAFDFGWNEEYEKCVIHGPIRASEASSNFALQQVELFSVGGWSTSGSVNRALVDTVTGHWDRAQPATSWAPQPCARIWTSANRDIPDPSIATFSAWRVAVRGEGFVIDAATDAHMPDGRDDVFPHLGYVLDGMLFFDTSLLMSFRWGCVRNSLFFRSVENITELGARIGTAIESRFKSDQPTWLIDMGTQAPCFAYNNTTIVAGSIDPSETEWYFIRASTLDPADSEQKSGRRLFEWNNARIKAATGPDASDGVSNLTALTATTTLGGTLAAPYAPQANSNAIGVIGVGLVPRYDAEGTERPERTAVGAFEVQS